MKLPKLQIEDRGILPRLVECYGKEYAKTQRFSAMLTHCENFPDYQAFCDANIDPGELGTGGTKFKAVCNLVMRHNENHGSTFGARQDEEGNISLLFVD